MLIIRNLSAADYPDWKRMRMALWPNADVIEHETEMKAISSGEILEDESGWHVLVAEDDGVLVGFIECSLRKTLAGCATSPVGYIEGWYVDADQRMRGVGKALMASAETWAISIGCQHMGSDVEFFNEISQKAHLKAGYRVIGQNEEGILYLKDISKNSV